MKMFERRWYTLLCVELSKISYFVITQKAGIFTKSIASDLTEEYTKNGVLSADDAMDITGMTSILYSAAADTVRFSSL